MSELADTSEDAFLGGRLRLRQPKSGHRAGHDAMLLAAATAARPGDRVVEFGAGVGAAGLALARRAAGAIALTLVEIEPRLARLAGDNASANGIAADVVVLDITAPAEAFASAGLKPDSADVVLMNPPFNDARHRASPDEARASAHIAQAETLDRWTHTARRLLKSGGALTLIWRADGLSEVLAALGRGFGSLTILPVHGDAAKPAIRVLVRAVKGGKAPTRILAGLLLNDQSGVPNKEVAQMLAGEGGLPLAAP
jgi:tRNA1(Val) A37 N6-methylase TrmN6